METNFTVARRPAEHPQTVEPAWPAPSPTDAAAWIVHLALTPRGCCCSAKPAVAAVMPPHPDRPYSIDLLLCGHHYRASQASLQAAGAIIYTGAPR